MKRLLIFLSVAVVVLGITLFLIGNPTAVSSSNRDMKKEAKGNELVSVKTYDLAGDGIEILFSMKDPKALELKYVDKQGEIKFSGQAITLVKLKDQDHLASVLLKAEPGKQRIILMLFVPSVNKPDNQKSINVNTFAVRTTIRDHMGGSRFVDGQIHAYEIHVLKGKAR